MVTAPIARTQEGPVHGKANGPFHTEGFWVPGRGWLEDRSSQQARDRTGAPTSTIVQNGNVSTWHDWTLAGAFSTRIGPF